MTTHRWLAAATAVVVSIATNGHGERAAAIWREPIVPIAVPMMSVVDLVADPVGGMVYASVGVQGGAASKAIVPIDPATGAVGAPLALSSQPYELAVSADGQYLYAGLDDEHAVQRIQIGGMQPDLRVDLGMADLSPGYPVGLTASDIEVVPGAADTIVVARRIHGGPQVDVAAFVGSTLLPTTTDGSTTIPYDVVFNGADPTRLYGKSGSSLVTMTVGPGGVTELATRIGVFNQLGHDVVATNGRLFDGSRLVDPVLGKALAIIPSDRPYGGVPAADVAHGRLLNVGRDESGYRINLDLYDPATLTAVGGFVASRSTAGEQLSSVSQVVVASNGNVVAAGPFAILVFGTGERRGASGEYTPLTPERVLDTRVGIGGPAAPFGAGGVREVQMTGVGGVPAIGVAAVVVNVTAVDPTERTYLTVWPSGLARPTISNLNVEPAGTRANLATVALGADGRLSIFNESGSVHVLFDVVGYYSTASGPAGSRFRAVAPQRLFDTRDGRGGAGSTPFGHEEQRDVPVTGLAGVPAGDVTAVVLNVTAVGAAGRGYITVWPSDANRPNASNINFDAGDTVPNLVLGRVSPAGVVSFFNFGGSTDLIADVVGYYTTAFSGEAGRFVPNAPHRVLDTRTMHIQTPTGLVTDRRPLQSGTTVLMGDRQVTTEYPIYVLNVTATGFDGAGYVTVHPYPWPLPEASNVNYAGTGSVANLAVGASITQVAFTNVGGSTHLVVDVFGVFSGG